MYILLKDMDTGKTVIILVVAIKNMHMLQVGTVASPGFRLLVVVDFQFKMAAPMLNKLSLVLRRISIKDQYAIVQKATLTNKGIAKRRKVWGLPPELAKTWTQIKAGRYEFLVRLSNSRSHSDNHSVTVFHCSLLTY